MLNTDFDTSDALNKCYLLLSLPLLRSSGESIGFGNQQMWAPPFPSHVILCKLLTSLNFRLLVSNMGNMIILSRVVIEQSIVAQKAFYKGEFCSLSFL